MKLKFLLVLFLSIGLLFSCKSKKPVAHTPIKKVYPKVVERQTEKKQIEVKDEVKSTIFSSTEDYIAYFKDAAMEEMKIYKIPASITLAQGIIESSSGNSELTKRSNNHFGIKCHKEWEGDTTFHDDDEKGECFRVYKDPATSFRDHSLFLTSRSRYSKLFKLNEGDFVSWAQGLSDAGYATDRRYPAKLVGLIEKFELHKYDTQVLGKSFEIDKTVQEKILTSKSSSENKVNNGEHIVLAKETLFSISKLYGLTIDDLKDLNSLSSDNLSIGQKLNLKNNSNKTQNSTIHIVIKGDTLFSVSKLYSLTVEELKKINGLNSNDLSIGQALLIK
jgi:LysM repeat protein